MSQNTKKPTEREEFLISVFEDTKKHPSFIDYNYKNGSKRSFGIEKAKIEVINEDCLLAVQRPEYNDGLCAQLNMASFIRAGGGVKKGSMAQEEELCRRTNLMHFIDHQKFYPLAMNEYIYTKGVTILKDQNYQSIEDGKVIDIITIAAIKLKVFKGSDEDYEFYTTLKIKTMFDVALKNNVQHLFLGAFGFGAYGNDPTFIAPIFKEIMNFYQYDFKSIIFPIINDNNSVGNNFQIFNEIING